MPTRVEPLEKDIELIVQEDLSPEAQSAAIAAFAREQLAGAEETNEQALGHLTPHTTFVDGVEGASEDSVRPNGGTIVYEFDLLLEMFAWIADQLDQHSPVGSGSDRHPGLYKRSHHFFADDQEADPANPPPGIQVGVFINDVPYSRKIEGDNNRAPESPEAPDGVYEVVAALAQRRFGNLAKISFDWRALSSGGVAEWAQTGSARKIASRRSTTEAKRTDWLTRQPAIIVTVR